MPLPKQRTSNYSFYLKCLAAMATAAVAGMVVMSVLSGGAAVAAIVSSIVPFLAIGLLLSLLFCQPFGSSVRRNYSAPSFWSMPYSYGSSSVVYPNPSTSVPGSGRNHHGHGGGYPGTTGNHHGHSGRTSSHDNHHGHRGGGIFSAPPLSSSSPVLSGGNHHGRGH